MAQLTSHKLVRKRLKNRRPSNTFAVQALGLNFVATVSYYDDGRPGEIFITSGKIDSAAAVMASESAICASLALQYGADLETIKRALGHNGPLAAAIAELVTP